MIAEHFLATRQREYMPPQIESTTHCLSTTGTSEAREVRYNKCLLNGLESHLVGASDQQLPTQGYTFYDAVKPMTDSSSPRWMPCNEGRPLSL
jgi:hypothetical protein